MQAVEQTGVKNGYLYLYGKNFSRQTVPARYALISIPNGNGSYQTYVINSSGRISKNTTVKDRDGNKYKVNSSGILTHINDEAASSTEITASRLSRYLRMTDMDPG